MPTAEGAAPRLYLVTPAAAPDTLLEPGEAMLATGEVACLRIDLGDAPEEDWVRAANLLMPPAHAAEVPVVVARHVEFVRRLGLDGVHLAAGSALAPVRKTLGRDAIIGADGGTTRHIAMSLAEAGADYVTLGPLTPETDALFEWWAEMIETPSVAEGGVAPEDAARLRDIADFVVPDPSLLWQAHDPAAALMAFARALAG